MAGDGCGWLWVAAAALMVGPSVPQRLWLFTATWLFAATTANGRRLASLVVGGYEWLWVAVDDCDSRGTHSDVAVERGCGAWLWVAVVDIARSHVAEEHG